jgi:hypothetical protein
MRFLTITIGLGLIGALSGHSTKNQTTEKDSSEEDIREAFKSAYSNRSDEIEKFFNETFGPGGDPHEVSSRFKDAWHSASQGVRHFVRETYDNITKIMKGENETMKAEASLRGITALVGEYDAAMQANRTSRGKEKTPKHETEEDAESESMLDTAWNYFKSVFGVTKSPGSEPPVLPEATMAGERPSSGKGMLLGFITLLAGVFLLFQTTLNRNSLVNKNVYETVPAARPEVPSGYVRLV